MNEPSKDLSERVLILAPQGRDADVARQILVEGGVSVGICANLPHLVSELTFGAGAAVLTEETIRNADIKSLATWSGSQPAWSDFPFVLLTGRGGGLERNPAAERQMSTLGNLAFLERPFHPTTFLSVVKTALRGRRRQYEARSRLEALRDSEAQARSAQVSLSKLNETLEARVIDRTSELEAANRQLVSQIEERERVENTLRQMQRLEAVGQLTSGVAHDFNNLLTVILGNLGFIEKDLGDANTKARQRISYIRLAAERGAKLVSQLLAFSRRQRLEPKPIDINEALESMHDLLQSSLGGSVQINTIFRPGVWWALVDPTQIELVVLNLTINARDAMGVGGSVTIETANATLEDPQRPEEPPSGEYVVISVTDTGSGIPRDVLTKVFEPFFTTKDVGKGSGLGLSQVLGFAKQSGGGVRIETRVGEGTTVRVYLPRATPTGVEQPANPLQPHQGHPKGAVILLLDDDKSVREITASLLRELDYVVLSAGSGGAALDLLVSNDGVDLALLDFAMPGMNGMEVARQIQARFPTLPILFITGYADTVALKEVGEGRIIKKPFVGDELAAKVLSALRSSPRLARKVVPFRS